MKTIHKIIIFTGLIMLSMQQLYAQSEFILQLNGRSSYIIYWDNNSHHYSGGNFIITDIFEGNHYLKIYRYKSGPHPHGMNYSKFLVYQGSVYIPASTRTTAHINQFGQFAILKQEPLPYFDPNPSPFYNPPMSAVAFRQLLDVIDDATFDSSKLQIAEQAARKNYLTAQQIATITELFGFESSRVKFAKSAYRNCVDPGNYFLVYKAFTFSSSIDELNRYIDGNQY